MIINHKFRNHEINEKTKILIVGTFNPDIPENDADFFYGRGRNYLWILLPKVFGFDSLKDKSKNEKKEFMNQCNIDFIDLIEEVEINSESAKNYAKEIYGDDFIDDKVKNWKNVIAVLQKNPYIKHVFFTRNTFTKIPKIKEKIDEIKKYCKDNNITFSCLPTPARFYNEKKLRQWENIFKSALK